MQVSDVAVRSGSVPRYAAAASSSRGRSAEGVGTDRAGQRRTADAVCDVIGRVSKGIVFRWPAEGVGGVGVPYPATAATRCGPWDVLLASTVARDRFVSRGSRGSGATFSSLEVVVPRPRVVGAGSTRHRDRHSRSRPWSRERNQLGSNPIGRSRAGRVPRGVRPLAGHIRAVDDRVRSRIAHRLRRATASPLARRFPTCAAYRRSRQGRAG